MRPSSEIKTFPGKVDFHEKQEGIVHFTVGGRLRCHDDAIVEPFDTYLKEDQDILVTFKGNEPICIKTA